MTAAPAVGGWLLAFGLTQLVEAPLYRWAAGASWTAALTASTLTHPVVWFVFPLLLHTGFDYVPMVAAAELFAVVIEALWLQRCRVSHPARWSVIANASSLCVGLGLRYAWGWP